LYVDQAMGYVRGCQENACSIPGKGITHQTRTSPRHLFEVLLQLGSSKSDRSLGLGRKDEADFLRLFFRLLGLSQRRQSRPTRTRRRVAQKVPPAEWQGVSQRVLRDLGATMVPVLHLDGAVEVCCASQAGSRWV
jgi:hypothetical protein